MDRDAGGRGTQVPVPSDSGLAGGEAGARIGRGSKPAAARASRRDGHRRVREGAVGASLGAALVYALFVLAAGTAAAGLAAWSALPYNVRELFRPDAPALTGALLAVAVLVVVVPAPFAARLLGAPGDALRRGGMFAGVCVVQGLLAWALVDAAVPLESVHDVVGSPVLDWPWRFEQLARFTVLVLPIAVLGAGAACAVDALRWRRRAMSVFAERGSSGLRWLAVALPLLVVAHVVVVELAATDNLTELMRGGGVVAASVLIALWLLVTFFAAHLIGAALAGAHYAIAAAALGVGAAAVVVGRGLLEFALAGALDKYGQVFSAMQFLLSPSRDALVSGGELMVRYAWFHSAVIAGVALAALPAWWVARAMGDGDRFAPESRTGGRVTKGSPHAGRGCAGGPGPVHSRLDAAGCAEPARARRLRGRALCRAACRQSAGDVPARRDSAHRAHPRRVPRRGVRGRRRIRERRTRPIRRGRCRCPPRDRRVARRFAARPAESRRRPRWRPGPAAARGPDRPPIRGRLA